MLLAVTPSTTAHAANAAAEQWRDEAAQWALLTARWNTLWTWEIISGAFMFVMLIILVVQMFHLNDQIRLLRERLG